MIFFEKCWTNKRSNFLWNCSKLIENFTIYKTAFKNVLEQMKISNYESQIVMYDLIDIRRNLKLCSCFFFLVLNLRHWQLQFKNIIIKAQWWSTSTDHLIVMVSVWQFNFFSKILSPNFHDRNPFWFFNNLDAIIAAKWLKVET